MQQVTSNNSLAVRGKEKKIRNEPIDIWQALGRRIRRARESVTPKLTQETCARLVGLPIGNTSLQNTWYRIETGNHHLSRSVLERFAALTNTTLPWLLFGIDPVEDSRAHMEVSTVIAEKPAPYEESLDVMMHRILRHYDKKVADLTEKVNAQSAEIHKRNLIIAELTTAKHDLMRRLDELEHKSKGGS